MRLTRYTDYAFRVLLYCALKGRGPATTQEIADRYGVSGNHLVKVVQELSRLNYLSAVRGKGGGLRLARPAADINLGELAAALEDMALAECFEVGGACRITPSCRLRGVLGEAQAAFIAVLRRYTLADIICGKETSLAAALGLPTTDLP